MSGSGGESEQHVIDLQPLIWANQPKQKRIQEICLILQTLDDVDVEGALLGLRRIQRQRRLPPVAPA